MIWLELDFTKNTTEATTYPNPLLFRNLKGVSSTTFGGANFR